MSPKENFVNDCLELFAQCPGNRIDIPGVGCIELFDPPVIAFASAADALFDQYKEADVVGSLFLSPKEWLPEAKTVAAFFFPFSKAVRESNREDREQPSIQWLYGRIEGQQFLNAYMERLQEYFTNAGLKVCVPSLDERFMTQKEPDGNDFHVNSRWSERHAAYACGLGTFGLSRGLITERGMAGRFASMMIDQELKPDVRPYSGIYDYCIRCGACARKCPAEAITLEYGKNNLKCNRYLDEIGKQYTPRYGCGKCQVGVPCEFKAPSGKACRFAVNDNDLSL